MMDGYQGNSNERSPFTFLNFGGDLSDRRKRQHEMNLEYQKFKALEEEKFRNRFADKKGGFHPSVESQTPVTRNLINDRPTLNVERNDTYHPTTSTLDAILIKLDTLQKNVEELKNTNTMESSNYRENQAVSNGSLQLLPAAPHTNKIQEAERRLHDLENIVSTLSKPTTPAQSTESRIGDVIQTSPRGNFFVVM